MTGASYKISFMSSTATAPRSLLLLSVLALPACSDPETPVAAEKSVVVRIAVFNIWELGREKLDEVDADGHGINAQLRGAAEIVQRVRPDVLLVNEIDFDPEERANARLFVDRYLNVGQGAQRPPGGTEGGETPEPIDYPHVYFGTVNTGFPTGVDLNLDGETDGPDDAYGFGKYPGQYGMALLSRLPIDAGGVRTFQEFLWRDQPGNLMPDGSGGKPAWYGPEHTAIFRLSSKSHWDVPLTVGERTLHVLAAHPTPSVFDGDEDRNGRRNYDEIRLLADYLAGGEAAAYLVDDAGRAGGLSPDASFVVMGDLNADPHTDEVPYGGPAIGQLLRHPRVRDPEPRGAGGATVDRPYSGPVELRTAFWGRLDYVLPSRDLEVRDAGVFWPVPEDPLHHLVADRETSSDHRMVWIDVVIE